MTLLPLEPTRAPSPPPALPARTALLGLHAGYSHSRHQFPAAHPRERTNSARRVSQAPAATVVNEGRVSKDEVVRRTDELLARQERTPRRDESGAGEAEAEVGLWICADRWVRDGATSGKTLIVCHANGLHKETWEPALQSLLKHSAKDAVREIWCLDSAHQGDSAVLNEGNVGTAVDWIDLGRDVAAFVLYYLPPPSSSPPPPVLTAQPTSILPNYSTTPAPSTPPILYRSHAIHGIGHSLGAACIALAASALPTVFHSITLIDATLFPPRSLPPGDPALVGITKGAVGRKDFWASKEQAMEEFKSKKDFFGKWDERVLERYVEFGLRDYQGGVTLKTPKTWEALVFADPGRRGSKASYARLHLLNPQLRLNWVFAAIHPVVPLEARDQLFEASKQCVGAQRGLVVEGSGHLIVQEKPNELGALVAGLMGQGEHQAKL